jgi:hypothetical protein
MASCRGHHGPDRRTAISPEYSATSVWLSLRMALLAMLAANPHVVDIVWRMAICGCGFVFFSKRRT